MIGTENILAERARTPAVADKIRRIIEAEELEVRKYLGPEASRIIARGNIAGGLTTIQEKALGCIRKGGRSQITDVLEYGEAIGGRKGLVIMRGPGYDPVSLTGLFSTGAQVLFYSTGRGNPWGYPCRTLHKNLLKQQNILRHGRRRRGHGYKRRRCNHRGPQSRSAWKALC